MIRNILVKYEDFKFFDEKYMDEYYGNSSLDITTLLKNKVMYVEIEMDDVNKKAYITFLNAERFSISEKLEDDWYAIMDRNFKCILVV